MTMHPQDKAIIDRALSDGDLGDVELRRRADIVAYNAIARESAILVSALVNEPSHPETKQVSAAAALTLHELTLQFHASARVQHDAQLRADALTAFAAKLTGGYALDFSSAEAMHQDIVRLLRREARIEVEPFSVPASNESGGV